jgi:hypothetical protein
MSMSRGLRYATSFGVTIAVFIVYAVLYEALHLSYGLRSVWPAFIFIFAFVFYLTSRPIAED